MQSWFWRRTGRRCPAGPYRLTQAWAGNKFDRETYKWCVAAPGLRPMSRPATRAQIPRVPVSDGADGRAAPGGGDRRGSALPPPAATTADQTTIRQANLGVVLGRVASRGRSSRARIASETGLTRGTVSRLVTELIELGLVRETGRNEGPPRVGRAHPPGVFPSNGSSGFLAPRRHKAPR